MVSCRYDLCFCFWIYGVEVNGLSLLLVLTIADQTIDRAASMYSERYIRYVVMFFLRATFALPGFGVVPGCAFGGSVGGPGHPNVLNVRILEISGFFRVSRFPSLPSYVVKIPKGDGNHIAREVLRFWPVPVVPGAPGIKG